MTAANGEGLIVRPQPSHDDAVPNANGVFAEALVRLAALTGTDEDRRLADGMLSALATAAAATPLGHMSILNALDLHLRGLAVVVVNDVKGTLRQAGLRLPYLERVVCSLSDTDTLPDTHPAKDLARSSHGPRALVCGGMRCSLPVAAPEDLARTAREMLTGDKQAGVKL
jgi:uncharacterized protein YyaL (SSP411 family)